MKKTIFWYRKYTTWSSCALAQQCYWKFPCTGTHAWCHNTCSSCAVTHILDATLLEAHVRWRTPCCAAWSSDAHMHWLDATVIKLRCYGVWSSCALAHILDATLFGSYVLVGLMLRYLKCMCASALHATLLEVHVCRYTWWYGIWSSVAAAVAAPVCRSEGVTRMSR